MYNFGNQGKIVRKLLRKPPTESSPDTNSIGISSSPILPPPYRSSTSRNATYFAGVPIDSIDKSADGQSVVLAGRHILRTVYFDGPTAIRDGIDLRALITTQTPNNKPTASTSASDQLSIRDVKWGSGHGVATLFTACANGRIFRYDLTRAGSGGGGSGTLAAAAVSGFDSIQMREDSRQVNTLDINPHRGTYLLSGSQDGIVRCFDIRQPVQTRGASLTFRAVQAFKCNAEGVRLVKWSPKDGFFFACATDQGVLLKWDIRRATSPLLRVNAHDKACTSLSWHPDGDHIVTGGWDSRCHVWDVSRQDKRQKPKWTISTPAPVSVVAWRPGQWSATAQAKRAAQISVSYDEGSQRRHGMSAVHVWDFARPTMPFREIAGFDRAPSALLWHDQDLLWAVGQDGTFVQRDVAFAPRVIDRQTVSTLDFSPRGDVLMFLDERPQSNRPRPHLVHAAHAYPTSSPHSYSSSPSTPMLSVSRSDSEDDMVGGFLGPRKRAGRRRRPSTRSTQGLSTTPPSGPGLPEEDVLSLENAIKITGIYKSQQAMAIGHCPAGVNVELYEYLAVNYLEKLSQALPAVPGNNRPLVERVGFMLEQYARAAENVRQFRLAQMWRVLAYAMNLLLTRRAQYHLEKRMERVQEAFFAADKKRSESRTRLAAETRFLVSGDVTPRHGQLPPSLAERALPGRSLLSEEIESTSNVATPLARPVDDSAMGDREALAFVPGKKLTPVLEADSFSLPPAAHPPTTFSPEIRRRLDSVPMSIASHDSGDTQLSSTEGYDFYDMDSMSKAIDVPTPNQNGIGRGRNRANPFLLDDTALASPSSRLRQRVHRHDSDESFTQMFSVSDGSKPVSDPSVFMEGSHADSAGRDNPAEVVDHFQASDKADIARGREYESRARGRYIQLSAERGGARSRPADMHIGRRDTDGRDSLVLTQMTDEHHLITQSTTDSSDSQRNVDGVGAVGASFALSSQQESSPGPSLASLGNSVVENGNDFDSEQAPHIIETDFLPWPDDPPYPYPISSSKFSSNLSPALQPCHIVAQALAFEARTSALNASAMVLLLKPLLPRGTIDSLQAGAILRQHHCRLMSMKLFPEAALLRTMCLRGWPGPPLSTWGDSYPAIYTPAQDDVRVAFYCATCRKPREIDRAPSSRGSIWRCERCEAVMAPCAVCGHRDTAPSILPASLTEDLRGSPGEDRVLSTWWYCPGCRHGGHSTCILGWHAAYASALEDESDHKYSAPAPSSALASTSHPDTGLPYSSVAVLDSAAIPQPHVIAENVDLSGGCCPLDGCEHACLPGPWRSESMAARSEDVSRAAAREARDAKQSSQELGPFSSGSLDGGVGTSAESATPDFASALGSGAVKPDGIDAAMSRAVEIVRGVLVDGRDPSSGRDGGGLMPTSVPMARALSSSPKGLTSGLSAFAGGYSAGERERRKSVKFVQPGRSNQS